MSRKKIIVLICSLIIILGIGVASGGIIASQQKTTTHKKTNNKKTNKHVDRTASKKTAKQSSSTSSMDDGSSKFNSLPQKTQLALLINQYSLSYKTTPFTDGVHYLPYMGVKDKIIITNDGGAGNILEHTFMVTDNNDGTFTFSSVESSAETMAYMGAKNSYWKTYAKTSKSAMMTEYNESTSTIDKLSSLIDLSHSSEDFQQLPADQITMPENGEQGDNAYSSSESNYDGSDDYDDDEDSNQSYEDEDNDQNDDDYYAEKAREPNADYYLPDGTHIHNDDQGNSYMDDGTVIGKGGSAGN